MAGNALNFELVSPEEKLVSEPVVMAVVPGVEGELGVGADHSSFVVALQPGVVKLYKGDDSIQSQNPSQKIFVSGGFADISSAGCSVLAEEAMPLDDLDVEELERKRRHLTEDLGLAVEGLDKSRIQDQLDLVDAKLYAVQA